ncbi:hypothetical protein DICPUDRAFT_155084 [Dictyostelium purpureum]|uniref:cysteine--tRNA ligase n=1 Tax=Dictyostelium purpureum TaxID=5786 RepID=F0ZT16_DICPU|nr:uncharacterized protein DICPUDRAFT_155084 [Dictyostelium purpureum]EGC32916.1 hypothetical protein DICPUDRAFT_155084 [Dictyostelium purpureum]|eukprot:XP_003290564.1 hypothetical protein DICPUDRAFT_155084 [Dictyostelium purpureum]
MIRLIKNNVNKLIVNNNNIISIRLYSTTTISPSSNITNKRKWEMPKIETSYDTGIQVKNSLANHQKVPLLISNSNIKNQRPISWYTCGPTVYSSSHIGHARNYVTVDIIQRILQDYFRLNIIHVMGMTDIDDKILIKSREKQISASELSRIYEKEFIEDLKSLNIKPPMFTTRVSEHMGEIINYIEKIRDNNLTYESTKSIFFNVEKFGFDRYSTLRAINEHGESKDLVDDTKKSNQDFVLWKSFNKDLDYDGKNEAVGWESPFGKGRPGWHIECSAMINSIFGNHLDVHSGGIDLEFPHHQNEIAQCEGHHSECNKDGSYQWANYFLHVGHLHLKNVKMSKSLNNVITIRDFLDKYTPNTLRWLCLIHRYTDPLVYSDETLKLCVEKELLFINWFKFVQNKLDEELVSVDKVKKTFNDSAALLEQLSNTKLKVEKDLANDFDTPAVVESLQSLMKQTRESIDTIDTDLLYNIQDYIKSILNVFGLDVSNLSNLPTNVGDNTNEFLLETLMDLRSDLKKLLKDVPNSQDPSFKEIKSKLYKITDQVRDKCLSEINLKVSDNANNDKPYTLEWLDKNQMQLLNIKNNNNQKK